MPFFGNRRRDFSIQPPRQQVDGTPFFVTDSANIDFTLNNLNLTADLTFTGVTAGTYGDATNIPVLQIDQWGRVTGVTLQAISPSGLALETNGTPNASQILLNLVAGTNITLTNSGGNVTINATGGPGGTYTVNNGLSADPLNPNNFQLGGNLTGNTVINTAVASRTLRFDATGGLNAFGAYAFTAVAGSTNLPNQVLASFRADDCTVASFTGQSFNGTGGTAVKIVSQHSSIVPLDIFGPSGIALLKVADTGLLTLGQYTTSTSFGSGLTSVGILNVDNTGKVFVGTGGGGAPTGPAGGDLSGTYPNPTVDGLQGQPISTTTPTIGKILQYNGTEWAPANIPSGGSGGGGVFYYFNYQNTTGISPTTGLPILPVPPSQLGITYNAISNSINSANLTQGVYTLVCGFVTIVGTPGITTIPAGLWDFNIWADVVGAAGSSNQTRFQIRVYKYDSSGAGTYTFIAQSDDIFIYDPSVIAQYIGNVTMPQTTLLVTDRIYIEFWAQKSVNQSRQISFHFGSTTPSHVHTTIPSVAGTGLVKVVNGVYQSPATLLFNADVDTNAAIAVNKLSMSTDRLLGRTTASTGSVEEIQLTTTGTSGAATLSGGFLNIPQYGGGSGGNSIASLSASSGDVSAAAVTSSETNVVATLKANLRTGSFGVTVDGVTGVVQVGTVGYVVMPYAGTITGWSITANVSGNIQFDIWKATNAIPTVANTQIPLAANRPKITAPQQYVNSTILTGWTTSFLANDVYGFYVDSVSTIKNATLTIRTTKT